MEGHLAMTLRKDHTVTFDSYHGHEMYLFVWQVGKVQRVTFRMH